MHLSHPILKKLSSAILSDLIKNKWVTLRVPEKAVLAKIESIMLSDAQIEESIEQEAKKTMDKFRAQVVSGEIDYHKMFQMVKKQLMKEKKFTP